MNNISPRPDVLPGKTYSIFVPEWNCHLYITVNHIDTDIKEIFLETKRTDKLEFLDTIAIALSAISRKEDPLFIFKELTTIHSAVTSWRGRLMTSMKEQMIPSVTAAIGMILIYRYEELKNEIR